jgi:assimilatory nitrate reductase catalytic subunit
VSEGWTPICDIDDVLSGAGVCALVEGHQIAVFRIAEAVFALDNFDPASEANVLSRGLVGDLKGERVVASPLYKHHYSLTTGRCLEDAEIRVNVHRARVLDGRIWVRVGGETVRTTCPYCGVGCGVLVRNIGGVVEVAGDGAHPAGLGKLCSKGYALGETVSLEGRALSALIGGEVATWDAALEHVASSLERIIAEHGPDSVAFYVSGQLLTEDYYVANKLMKGYIGSANIDTNSRLCMASAVAGHKRAFGEDLVPGCYEDLQLADLIVLVGANTAWCHPVLFRRIIDERERRPELRLVVIDPRRTPTCELADLHLPVRAGTDVWLFNGLLAYLRCHGIIDRQFVAEHTVGANEAVAAAEQSALGEAAVAKICGVDVGKLTEFYQLFAANEKVVTAFSQGVNQSSVGTDKVNAIINCHLLTGRVGRPGMGPFSLTGQPNAMGGREVGGLANTLAAHMELEDPEHREAVQTFWGSPSIASRCGLKAVDLFEAMHAGKIKAVWIMGTNPVVSMPDADRVREALERCELVVVSDCVAKTDTTAYAHVLLPAAGWGEKDGTVTNSERCISRQRSFLDLPGQARPDWWIICEVAKRLGHGHAFGFRSAAEVFDEHARLSGVLATRPRGFDITGLAGMTAAQYENLQPIRWPVRRGHCSNATTNGGGRAGTRRLFEDGRFMHPDGRARLVPTPPRAPANDLSAEFPLVLNTGRIRDQWHTMTRTGRAPRLAEFHPEPYVDIHPQDALLTAARIGELARVTTRWGSIIVRVRSSGEIARGTLFVPMHWNDSNASQARVGALVNPVVDPISGEPEFKHTPVRVEPFPVEWHGFLLTRHELASRPDVTWWTKVNAADNCTRYEMAGRDLPLSWSEWGRGMLGAADEPDTDYIEYEDSDARAYRAAYIVDGRLHACLYVANRADLPDRALVARLFAVGQIEASHRMALLTTGAVVEGEDPGALVCSCFAVGRNTICRAIEERGLTDARQVGACLRAGTNCGSCLPDIRSLLSNAAHQPFENGRQQQHRAAADRAPQEDLEEQGRQRLESGGVVVAGELAG